MSAASSVFFQRTYDEAVKLLVETRNYMANMDPANSPGLAPADRLRISCETMRITARLAQVMAWMLAQRAAESGELTQDEASGPRFRIPDDPTCLIESEIDASGLPVRLVDLLSSSRRLYVRVKHLDELVRRSVESEMHVN